MSRLNVSFTKLHSYVCANAPKLNTFWIDGDIFVYTLGFAVEERLEWPDGETEITGDLQLAKRLLDNRIRYFTNSIWPGATYRFVITGDAPNWRKTIADTYKAKRGRKPMDYQGLRNYMRELPVFHETTDGLEADDFLAAVASADRDGTAIISFDKDFFTVPGIFIHMAQNSSARLYHITPVQAISFLFFQALAGDPVDSYGGVDNVGKCKAGKLLVFMHIKELTIGCAYLALKRALRKRQATDPDSRDLWKQFRTCLDLAALTWDGEEASAGIGLRRVFKHRHEQFEYFLPYYDVTETNTRSAVRL